MKARDERKVMTVDRARSIACVYCKKRAKDRRANANCGCSGNEAESDRIEIEARREGTAGANETRFGRKIGNLSIKSERHAHGNDTLMVGEWSNFHGDARNFDALR